MILEASITVTAQEEVAAPAAGAVPAVPRILTETLFPARHHISLPLNCLNNLFQSCEVAFNYHTKLDCDR